MSQNDSEEKWGYGVINNLTGKSSYHEPILPREQASDLQIRLITVLEKMFNYEVETNHEGTVVYAYLSNDKFRDKRLLCHTLVFLPASKWEKLIEGAQNLIKIETARRISKEETDAIRPN